MTEAEQVRDIGKWPRWPWLPVKHPESSRIGVVYADDVDLPQDPEANGPIRVFDINVFECSMTAAVALAQGRACPWEIHGTYDNVEALIADGWRGD